MGVNSRRRPRNKADEATFAARKQMEEERKKKQETGSGQETTTPRISRSTKETIKHVVPTMITAIVSIVLVRIAGDYFSVPLPPPIEAEPDFAVPAWIEVTGKVPRIEADELSNLGNRLVATPFIVTQSRWTGSVRKANFSIDSLADLFPELPHVRKLKDAQQGRNEHVFVYEDNQRLMRAWDADTSKLGAPRIEVLESMKTEDFLASDEPLYFSHKWNEDFETKLGKDLPINYMRILSEFSPKNRTDEEVFKVNFWLTAANTAAGLHYDPAHNMFGQIAGCKRFIIVNSSEWNNALLYPLYHPHDRQSQLENMPEDQLPLSPLPALIADLNPGDTLYIPPLTMHRVATYECKGQTHSASVNAWSRSAANALVTESQSLENLPPIFADVSSSTINKALPSLTYFLKGVLEGVLGSGVSAKTFLLEDILAQRYTADPIVSKALECDLDFQPTRCPAKLTHPTEELLEDEMEALDTNIKLTVDLFEKYQAMVPSFDLVLADFTERVITLVVGIPKVCTAMPCIAQAME